MLLLYAMPQFGFKVVISALMKHNQNISQLWKVLKMPHILTHQVLSRGFVLYEKQTLTSIS